MLITQTARFTVQLAFGFGFESVVVAMATSVNKLHALSNSDVIVPLRQLILAVAIGNRKQTSFG